MTGHGRNRGGRRLLALAAALTLLALTPLPLGAADQFTTEGDGVPDIGVDEAFEYRDLLFTGRVDGSGARYPRVATQRYRPDLSGNHLIELVWSSGAHLQLFIYDSAGDLIAARRDESQPKRLRLQLEAGERYRIRVRARSGIAAFSVRVTEDPIAWIDALPTWRRAHGGPVEFTATETTGGWEPDPDDAMLQCQTTTTNLENSPEEIVTFNPRAGILYPGVLLQGNPFESGGEFVELPIRQREPVTVSIDFSSGNVARTVENVRPSEIAAAVGDIIEQAENAGHTTGTSVFGKFVETFSAEQMAMEIDISISYLSSSVKAGLDMEHSTEQKVVTVYFKESAFTASADLPQTPGEFFSSRLTATRLDQQIGLDRIDEDNPPVYVSDVTYGRILMFSFTTTATESEIQTAFSGVYDDGTLEVDAEAQARWQQVTENSTYEVFTLGGRSEAATAAFASGNFRHYFKEGVPLTAYKPISYQLKDLYGRTAYLGETTEYQTSKCRLDPPCDTCTVTVWFEKAELLQVNDAGGELEMNRFFLEARPLDRRQSGPTPVFDTNDPCIFGSGYGPPQPDPGLADGRKEIVCWSTYPWLRLWPGNEWRPALAQSPDHWKVDIPFDNTGVDGTLRKAELWFRAGAMDCDSGEGPANDDWAWAWDPEGPLTGAAMFDDYLPDDPDATYRFEVHTPNQAQWYIYVTIELTGLD